MDNRCQPEVVHKSGRSGDSNTPLHPWATYDAHMATPGAFPAAAVAWLAPERPGNVLAIGTASAPTAAHLQRLGNRVTFATRAPADVHRACTRHPSFRGVAAAPDALPFVPCTFDAVLVSQGMHQLPPGLVLAEFARVLAPGGRLAVVATFRDDSVPWVRRLAAIVQRYDPKAMRAADEAAATIPASAHFPQVEQRDFRRWVPITREGMLNLVSEAPGLAGLDLSVAEPLLAEVAELYDSSAPRAEPLLLPYAVRCSRAEVDHTELSSVLRLPEDGLQINLQSRPFGSDSD